MIVMPASWSAIGAYVPIWFFRHLETQVSVWQWAAGIFAVMLIVGNVALTRSGYGLRSPFQSEIRSIVHPLLYWVSMTFFATNIVLIGNNAASWPIQSNQTIHEIILTLMIGQATLQFASMVLYRPVDSV